MAIHNLMTCDGFGVDGALACNSEFIMAWVGLLLLAIIFIFAKKFLGEDEAAGMPFNWMASMAGFLGYFLLEALVGNFKLAFLVGLLSMIGLGFLLAPIIGGSGE